MKSLFDLLNRFPVVAVIGVRQAGKTTLCQSLGTPWKLYDLEKEQDYQLIKRDPYFFLKQNPRQIIIDESQELPELFPALRVIVDESRRENGRFIITGSSSPDLLSQIAESLAGRVAILELSPFKSTERWQSPISGLYEAIGDDINTDALLNLRPGISNERIRESWLWGGYPEPVLNGEPKTLSMWMDNYQRTYLQRDIRKLFPRLNVEAFRVFVSMLARLSGTIANLSEIAGALSVSQPTIKKYIEIADGTFIWRKLSPFTKNVKKRISKMPKGYLRDSGLLHFLLHIDSHDKLAVDPVVGRSWESFVIEEIIRGMQIQLIQFTPYYYRTGHGAEIDLILEGGFGILPIEIKYGTKIDMRSLSVLRDFIGKHRLKAGIVISNADYTKWLLPGILHLPAGVL